jgi:bifunctional non-homologous end joining protein LigD
VAKSSVAGARTRSRPKTSLPVFIAPQLCTAVAQPAAGEKWIHEVKFDGYRAQLRVSAGKASIRSRNGLEWTARLPLIATRAGYLPDSIIDGELVALGAEGLPDFSQLQHTFGGDTSALVFFAFDFLFGETGDCREAPLAERKAKLRQVLSDGIDAPNLRFVDHFREDGRSVLESARRLNLEGIVSKRIDAPYRSGRTHTWTKVKCRLGQEVVIGGWTGTEKLLRALLVGVYADGQLTYVGRVGTGFPARFHGQLLAELLARKSPHNPFVGAGLSSGRGVHWVKPQLVADVECAGWTHSGHLRQVSFKGLRTDKAPEQVEREYTQEG